MEIEGPTIGRGEVLLRPLTCGTCTSDVKQVCVGYTGGPRYALGHELVCEVMAASQGAKWQAGDRVAAAPYVPCGSFGVGPYHVAQALRLLVSGQVNASRLVTATFTFNEAPEAITYAMNRIGVVVTFAEAR